MTTGYLPPELPKVKVLITVKTYPLPSHRYEELVCTAGLLADGKWIRIYPVPFRSLAYGKQYSKYNWIEVDLVRNSNDFRPESYRPKSEIINTVGSIGTAKGWAERKDIVLTEVFASMGTLIDLAKGETKKSLATLKPSEITDFVVEEDEREWKPEWQEQLLQYRLFDLDEEGRGKLRRVVRKLPYKYSYVFLSEGDQRPHKLMIEDWEIGALYWNCLARSGGDEQEANRMVRKKYFDEIAKTKDVYLFVGTTKQYHNVSPNPFVIIGVFYPPKSTQLSLF